MTQTAMQTLIKWGDKMMLTAKNIATYVCNEVLNYSKDHGFIGLTEYLQEVKQEIQKI